MIRPVMPTEAEIIAGMSTELVAEHVSELLSYAKRLEDDVDRLRAERDAAVKGEIATRAQVIALRAEVETLRAENAEHEEEHWRVCAIVAEYGQYVTDAPHDGVRGLGDEIDRLRDECDAARKAVNP